MQLERGDLRFFLTLARKDGEIELSFGGGQNKDYGTQTFAKIADARAAYERMVAEKVADGYRDVSSLRDPRLEAALRAQRDDVTARLAYADWLDARGSPVAAFMRSPRQSPEAIE